MTDRPPEVRQLTALIALARELHFGRAAQRLGITQPGLSQLIRDLETKLGFRVVERTTRKVLLTAAGSTFLMQAEAIVRQLDRAIENGRIAAGQEATSIRIGAILPVAFEFLPAVLTVFRRRHPLARVHIETKESPQLVTALESGALHVALLRPPRRNGTLRVETLRRESFVLAMRADHPRAGSPSLCLGDLLSERIIRIERGDLREAFDEIDGQLERAGIGLRESQVTDSTLTAMALVAAGDGVSLVPSWAAAMPWRDVCLRPVADLNAGIDLAIAWDPSNVAPITQLFIDVARRLGAADMGAPAP